MKYTHEIYICELREPLDLTALCLDHSEIKRSPFYCMHWQQFGILCQLYPSGKILCHSSLQVLSQYLEMLAKPVKEIRLSTRSAVHDLKGKVNYHKLCRELPNVSYEPEIFHAALLKCGSINFTIFQSGKVCITGIKTSEDEDDIVIPILLELELCVF